MRNEEYIKSLETTKEIALSTLDSRYATKSDLNNIDKSLRGPEGAKGDKGDKGETGEQGPEGEAGAKWYSGDGVPSSVLGIDGDFYIDRVTKFVYYKDSGSWDYDLTLSVDSFSSGRFSENTISNLGDGSVSITTSDYALYSDCIFTGIPQKFTISGDTFSLIDKTTNYIVADYNSGSPILRNTLDVSEIDLSCIIPVYTVIRTGLYLHILDWDTMARGSVEKLINRLVKTQRFARENGLFISEIATRKIGITQGYAWYGVTRKNLEAFTSGDVGTQTFLYYSDGLGGYSYNVVSEYNNTQYDNGTGLQTLTTNRYAVNWIFRGVENNKHLYIVLGTDDYLESGALNSVLPTVPEVISNHAILVGRIIVQKNSDTATRVDRIFDVGFGGGAGGAGDVTSAGDNTFTGSNTFTQITKIESIRAYSSAFRILNNNPLYNNGVEFGFFSSSVGIIKPANAGFGAGALTVGGSVGSLDNGALYLRSGSASAPDAGAFLTLWGADYTNLGNNLILSTGFGGELRLTNYKSTGFGGCILTFDEGQANISADLFTYGGYEVLTKNDTTDDLPEGSTNKYLTGNEAFVNTTNTFSANQVVNGNITANALLVDEIYDRNGAGITIKDQVFLEDLTRVTGNFFTDIIYEQTLNNGILIDLLRIKDGRAYADSTISEDNKLTTSAEVDTKIDDIYINIDGGSSASTYGGLPFIVDGGTA